jgi:IstB-like ATP binding protein
MNKDSLSKMNRMRFLGMHLAFETSIQTRQMELFTNDELVHHLIQAEWDDRQYRHLQRGLKNANFRYKASLEQLDYADERGWIKIWYSVYLPAPSLKREKIFLSPEAPVPEKAFWLPHWVNRPAYWATKFCILIPLNSCLS